MKKLTKLILLSSVLLLSCSGPSNPGPNYKIEDIEFVREMSVRKETTRFPEMTMYLSEILYFYNIRISKDDKLYNAEVVSKKPLQYEIGDSIYIKDFKIYN